MPSQAELEVACRARPDVKQSHSGRAEARAERRATTRERRSREPSSREPEQSREKREHTCVDSRTGQKARADCLPVKVSACAQAKWLASWPCCTLLWG